MEQTQSDIFVFYGSCNNYHKHGVLKQHKCFLKIMQVRRVVMSHWVKIKKSAKSYCSSEALGENLLIDSFRLLAEFRSNEAVGKNSRSLASFHPGVFLNF